MTIPPALVETPQWICWTHETRGDDGPTKVPRAPWNVNHTGPASAKDPDNMVSFETANEWATKTPGWHLGFCFRADGEFVGVDLDKCRDPESGEVDKWAVEIVADLNSFAEVSPSGTGLHVLLRGGLDEPMKNDEQGVEVYDRERYFTVTGNHFPSAPTDIREAQDTLDDLVAEYEPIRPEAPDPDEVDRNISTPPSGGNSNHPFYDLQVIDLYPAIPVAENVAHPEHESKTGSNFKIHGTGATAVCWHGSHSDPANPAGGVGLGPQHLLAMQRTGRKHCWKVRKRYKDDDELAYKAWLEAVDQGLIDPDPPIWRAIQHVATKHDITDPAEGGTSGWASYRTACRIIRHKHGYNIELSRPDE